MVPRASLSSEACNRNRTGRRAHESCSRALPAIQNMRKGEPKILRTDWPAFNTPAARSCHTLLACQAAHCRPAPPLPHFPGLPAPNLLGAKFNAGTFVRSKAESPGRRLKWIRCRGLGKSVPGKLGLESQSAAHGQITERKPSVPHLRLSLARRTTPMSLPCRSC